MHQSGAVTLRELACVFADVPGDDDRKSHGTVGDNARFIG